MISEAELHYQHFNTLPSGSTSHIDPFQIESLIFVLSRRNNFHFEPTQFSLLRVIFISILFSETRLIKSVASFYVQFLFLKC